jgi:hypothetical protein
MGARVGLGNWDVGALREPWVPSRLVRQAEADAGPNAMRRRLPGVGGGVTLACGAARACYGQATRPAQTKWGPSAVVLPE